MPTTPYLYMIIFGKFEALASKATITGPSMCIGHTIGEEVIFEKDSKKVHTESVISMASSCVL